jgi:hypothetical protein
MRSGSLLGLVLVGLACAQALPWSAQASARQRAQESVSAVPRIQKMQAPSGTEYLWRGNCIIIETQTEEDVEWDDSGCDRNVQGAIGPAYGWFVDRLALSFSVAEELACGSKGCVTEGRSVRFYLTWGQVPWLRTTRTDDRIEVRMNTAFVDATEAFARTYLAELRAQGQGEGGRFTQWLASIGQLGGKPCQPLEKPERQVAREDIETVMNMGLSFYVFAMLHEVAHVVGGEDCGAGMDADDLSQEMTCDERAFDWMGRMPLRLPPLFVVPMVQLSHHQAVLDPLLAKESGLEPGKLYSEENPAARWHERAELLLNRWESLCLEDKKANSASCTQGWRASVADTRRLLALPLPRACGPAQPPAQVAIQADPAAAQCLRFRWRVEDPILWVKDGDPPVVKVLRRYQNICDRPVRCDLQFLTGTKPKKEGDPEKWRPYKSRTLRFELVPGKTRRLSTTVEWEADAQRFSVLRFPAPPREDMELLACEFSGAPVPPAPRDDGPACEVLQALVTSAGQRFQDLRGAEDGNSESMRSWKLNKPVPGTKTCRVVTSERWDYISCDYEKFEAEDALQRAYQETSTAIKACFPGVVVTEMRTNGFEELIGFEIIRGRKSSLEEDKLPVRFEVEQAVYLDVPSYHLSLTIWMKARGE